MIFALRFRCSKSGHIYLHTDIRMIFARRAPDIDHDPSNVSLYSITEGPTNPRYTTITSRKPWNVYGISALSENAICLSFCIISFFWFLKNFQHVYIQNWLLYSFTINIQHFIWPCKCYMMETACSYPSFCMFVGVERGRYKHWTELKYFGPKAVMKAYLWLCSSYW